jgi:hypothetical protein
MINNDIDISSDTYDDDKWSIISDDVDVNYCDDNITDFRLQKVYENGLKSVKNKSNNNDRKSRATIRK